MVAEPQPLQIQIWHLLLIRLFHEGARSCGPYPDPRAASGGLLNQPDKEVAPRPPGSLRPQSQKKRRRSRSHVFLNQRVRLQNPRAGSQRR
jgi:hypothetical protein